MNICRDCKRMERRVVYRCLRHHKICPVTGDCIYDLCLIIKNDGNCGQLEDMSKNQKSASHFLCQCWPELCPETGKLRFFLCNDRNPVGACIFYEEKEDE